MESPETNQEHWSGPDEFLNKYQSSSKDEQQHESAIRFSNCLVIIKHLSASSDSNKTNNIKEHWSGPDGMFDH